MCENTGKPLSDTDKILANERAKERTSVGWTASFSFFEKFWTASYAGFFSLHTLLSVRFGIAPVLALHSRIKLTFVAQRRGPLYVS